MKIRLIFNPKSGPHGGREPMLKMLREFASARTSDAELSTTDGPGHATELAREAVASGCARVVAAGGDGTMNEVAAALVNAPAELALVPCGTGNGLARHLGIPRSPPGALRLAGGTGRVSRIDAGTAAGMPFFNVMGLGLDAEISRRFNRITRRSLAAYIRAAWAAFRSHAPERLVIGENGASCEMDALLVTVANSDQYGNNAVIARGARVDDGMLDLVAVEAVGLAGAAVIGARLFLGRLDGSPRVRRMRAPRFLIRRGAPGLIHTDGETRAAPAAVEVAVVPGGLRIVVP